MGRRPKDFKMPDEKAEPTKNPVTAKNSKGAGRPKGLKNAPKDVIEKKKKLKEKPIAVIPKEKAEEGPIAAEKPEMRRGPKLKGPVTDADFENFENLLKLQCTVEECAAWWDCDVKTIYARVEDRYGMKFQAIAAIKRDAGKISLRRVQMQKALSGSVPMLIWLGKQYLGQRDKFEELKGEGEELELTDYDKLQAEIEKRHDRFAQMRLRNRSVEDFEAQLLEKAKAKKLEAGK